MVGLELFKGSTAVYRRNFGWPTITISKVQFTTTPFKLQSKNKEDFVIIFSDILTNIFFSLQHKSASHFGWKTTIEKKQALIAWRVTWNYVYSPLQHFQRSLCVYFYKLINFLILNIMSFFLNLNVAVTISLGSYRDIQG